MLSRCVRRPVAVVHCWASFRPDWWVTLDPSPSPPSLTGGGNMSHVLFHCKCICQRQTNPKTDQDLVGGRGLALNPSSCMQCQTHNISLSHIFFPSSLPPPFPLPMPCLLLPGLQGVPALHDSYLDLSGSGAPCQSTGGGGGCEDGHRRPQRPLC